MMPVAWCEGYLLNCRRDIEHIRSELCEKQALIYAQKDYWDKYLAADFSSYPRWARNVFYPVFVDVGDDWTVWQYNDRGVLDGYSGEKFIDLNIVNNKKGLDALRY